MRNTTFCILAAAVLLAASCEKAEFLNRSPYSSTAPENFYSNESQMNMALVSCYETMNTHKIPGLTYCQRGSYAQGLMYLMNAPSDCVVGSASAMGEGVEMEQCTFDEGSNCIRHFWKVFYTGINRCNTILAYIDGISSISDDKKTQYKAEARFMRAFYYYHLAWNFGGIPIVTNYASTGDEPRSSLKDVYTEIILPDLEFASANLLPSGGLITNVSADKYVAEAYLGRICNYLAACKRYGTGAELVAEQPLNDFSWVDAEAMSLKAKNALEDVCLKSPYSLNPDYRVNFLEAAKSEQRKECMFLAEQPLSGSEGYWPNSFYIPTPVNAGEWPTSYGGRHIPTYRGFYMFSPKDARRDWNYTGRSADGHVEVKISNYTYSSPVMQDSLTITVTDANDDPVIDPGTGEPKKEKILHPIYDSPTQTYRPNSNLQVCTGKFRLAKTEELQRTYQQSALSYPLMRLADVYLMYAEALYFNGDESTGREWMNKVLRRAATDDENYNELLAAYHRDDFIEELLESRERELSMECSRRWDLIRFNRIDAAIASLDAETVSEYNGEPIDPKYLEIPETSSLHILINTLKQNWMSFKIWLPISEEQRGVNKGLTQNAGWSAGV